MLAADVCIVGGGPGGLAAAASLALHGQKVIVINDGPLMGYGIDGAFKSKAQFEITRQYVYASLRPEVFGTVPAPTFDAVLQGTRRSAADLHTSVIDRMDRLGVTIMPGRGVFKDPNTVTVGEQQVRADHIVIATGSRPAIPKRIDTSSARVLTSDSVQALKSLPKSILVLGAGVIGCEFANIFAALGADVTLVDSQPRILAMEDPDISAFLARTFAERGIKVLPDCRFEDVTDNGQVVRTRLTDGRIVATEAVLLAIGRAACTANLELQRAGVAVDDRGYIPTNRVMQTNISHIYAVGDVGKRQTPVDMSLVHVAQAEGRCAAHHLLGDTFDENLDHVPYIIFTIPMVAGAGLSETVARERHGEVRVGKYPYGRNHRAHTLFPPLGFVKLIVGPEGDDRILGVRVIGRDADSLVSAASIMIERQLPYDYLIHAIMPHPSLMECLQGAAHIIRGDALAYEEGEEFDFGTLTQSAR
jgi:dihydrolipoamide dehydrogenase